MSEIDLLRQCINEEGEAEAGGVKYIWMDENTVYRFENNRMKKVSKQLINKARKSNEQANEVKPKPKKQKVKAKQPDVEVIESDAEAEEECEEEVIVKPKAKTVKQKIKQQQVKQPAAYPNVDLDEYYNNKHKMEYMNLEITRLNNKISRLKQYKNIVNKLTGGEIDDIKDDQPQQSVSIGRKNNDSLFMF